MDPSGNWRLDNFLVSTLQVAQYAAMFVPGPWSIPLAIANSAAQAGLQGGHIDEAMQAGMIGGISAGIGQGVAQGIGPAGIGENFGRAVAAGAGAGFAAGGAGAILSGQSGANAWKAAYQGAAMGAATAGVMWGIQQGNSDIANYRELVSGYRQARAAAKSLDISGYPQYAMAGDARSQIVMDGGKVPAKTWSNFYYPRINKAGLTFGFAEISGGALSIYSGLAIVGGTAGTASLTGIGMIGGGIKLMSTGIYDFMISFYGEGPSLLLINGAIMPIYYSLQGEQLPPQNIKK